MGISFIINFSLYLAHTLTQVVKALFKSVFVHQEKLFQPRLRIRFDWQTLGKSGQATQRSIRRRSRPTMIITTDWSIVEKVVDTRDQVGFDFFVLFDLGLFLSHLTTVN